MVDNGGIEVSIHPSIHVPVVVIPLPAARAGPEPWNGAGLACARDVGWTGNKRGAMAGGLPPAVTGLAVGPSPGKSTVQRGNSASAQDIAAAPARPPSGQVPMASPGPPSWPWGRERCLGLLAVSSLWAPHGHWEQAVPWPNGTARRSGVSPGTRRPAPQTRFRVVPTRWRTPSPAAMTGGGGAPHGMRRGWTCVRPRSLGDAFARRPTRWPGATPARCPARGLQPPGFGQEGVGDIEAASLPGQNAGNRRGGLDARARARATGPASVSRTAPTQGVP